MSKRTILKEIWRGDRQRSVTVIKSGDFFTFEENGNEVDVGVTFWAPISGGGLYETAEAAELAARAEISWLRDQI